MTGKSGLLQHLMLRDRTPMTQPMPQNNRIFLSPPHMGAAERDLLIDAFDSNWIAPLGPHVDAFEREFATTVGVRSAAALASGTAALHLAFRLLGLQRGDEVICSSLTFAASANPILYEDAIPVFIDSERQSWNMDPELLQQAIESRLKATGKLPRAVILVHLYGQCAQLEQIEAICNTFGIPLIEDAAEALGARYWGSNPPQDPDSSTAGVAPGSRGRFGIYSFNGNKIITTSGGGMLVSPDPEQTAKARMLASQARDPAPHYQHSQLGYNYRLSNLLAAVGRGQLQNLENRVQARRAVFARYVDNLGDLPGINFMPEAPWGRHNRWLTCLTIDPSIAKADREAVRLALEAANIEARPVWKPLHLQPLYTDFPMHNNGVAEQLFADGLCLPSGSSLSTDDQQRVCEIVRSILE